MPNDLHLLEHLDCVVVPARSVRRLMARRDRGRPRQRRGIILVFVVVLLMLLAVMGTAYLASSRADRTGITGRGQTPGANVPRLADRGTLDSVFAATSLRVQNELVTDLFNAAPGTMSGLQTSAGITGTGGDLARATLLGAFRQEYLESEPGQTDRAKKAGSANWYENYDSPGRADTWLSSLLPVRDATTPTEIAWPWIGAPLVGEIAPGIRTAPFFSDPRALSRTAPTSYPPSPFSINTPPGGPLDYLVAFKAQHDKDAVSGFTFWYDYQKPVLPYALQSPVTEYDQERANAKITAVPLVRGTLPNKYVKNTRVYPGLDVTSLYSVSNNIFIAADADGDGMADGGLSPVILHPDKGGVDRYLDTANGVVYFVGYRVVDNSAQINFNTALTAQGDFNFTNNTTGAPQAINISATEDVNGAGNLEFRNRLASRGADGPNLGFFRSNVGLIELVQSGLEVYGAANATQPMFREAFRLIDARLPQLAAKPQNDIEGANSRFLALSQDPNTTPTTPAQVVASYFEATRDNPGAPTNQAAFEFRSLGDMLEQQVARRPANVGGMRFNAGGTPDLVATAFNVLPIADAASLAARGGTLINDSLTPGQGESALLMSTRLSAPNYSTTEAMWKWFPLSLDGSYTGTNNGIDKAVGLWFDWSKNFQAAAWDPNTAFIPTATGSNPASAAIDAIDQAAAKDRVFAYNAPGGSGLTDVGLPRPLRSILTTHSGVTNAVPQRYIGVNQLPAGMPAYGDDATKFEYPAIRVAAATAPKEALWRAYWSVMTQSQRSSATSTAVTSNVDRDMQPLPSGPISSYASAATFEAFEPSDRHPSKPFKTSDPPYDSTVDPQWRLNPAQMALVRSAIAACNTVDLRDSDNDITAMTVDLGHVVPAKTPQTSESLFARVYGTEKQLVITAVVIDCIGNVGDPSDLCAVELFNPSDEELDLSGYYIGIEDRPSTGSLTLKTATVTINNAPGVPGTSGPARAKLVLPTDAVRTLKPGGYMILSNQPIPTGGGSFPGHTGVDVAPMKSAPAAGTPIPINTVPQVMHLQLPMLTNLINSQRELVLLRTRRADGVLYADPTSVADATTPTGPNDARTNRRPLFNEDNATNAGLNSLVPLDAVDCRTLRTTVEYQNLSGLGTRQWYLRNTFDPQAMAPNLKSWKCFYAGQFYDYRPSRGATTRPVGPPIDELPPKPDEPTVTDWAWRSYPADRTSGSSETSFAATETLGGTTLTPFRIANQRAETNPATSVGIPSPYQSPTIPIQKFRPISTFYETGNPAPINRATGVVDHAPNRFPYGSPFARNGDVLAVPFIGSYKIYRLPYNFTAATAAASYELYDYVPVTMDAVSVTSEPSKCVSNPSVGRFDPRDTIAPHNTWSSDLFDFVVARQSSSDEAFFPDVPAQQSFVPASGAPLYNDPTNPVTDQDGPVLGFNTAANLQARVPWVRWQIDGSGAPTSARRQGAAAEASSASQLVEGTMNLNTAPPVSLRMLPWIVDPSPITGGGTTGGGRLDQRPLTAGGTANPWNEQIRRRVGRFTFALTQDNAKLQNAAAIIPPFGITSLMNVIPYNDVSSTDAAVDNVLLNASASTSQSSFNAALTAGTASSEQNMMRLGMLNPRARPDLAHDFSAINLNMTRISNLASQRSDCYTVYVTVQAWTWVGDTTGAVQQTDTRLVGERRASFIVDRSRISATRYKPSDLIVYPIESE